MGRAVERATYVEGVFVEDAETLELLYLVGGVAPQVIAVFVLRVGLVLGDVMALDGPVVVPPPDPDGLGVLALHQGHVFIRAVVVLGPEVDLGDAETLALVLYGACLTGLPEAGVFDIRLLLVGPDLVGVKELGVILDEDHEVGLAGLELLGNVLDEDGSLLGDLLQEVDPAFDFNDVH